MNAALQITRWERLAITILSASIMLFLAVFALNYADERLYADSGYYLFRSINEGAFHIEHGRWVLALAEWLPLLGSKLGLPLPAIIQLHLLGNLVFVALAMGYAAFVLCDQRTVLALAAVQLIGLALGLFCPVFELYYGVGLVILFMATLKNSGVEGRTRLFLACLLFALALSSHPMAWLLLAGSILMLDHRERRPMLMLLGIIAVAFALLRAANMSEYEAAQLSFAQRLAFPSLVFGLFKPNVIAEQAVHAWSHYPDVIVLALLCMAVLWRTPKDLLLFVSGLLILYVLVGLYLPDVRHDRYREQVDFAFAAWTILVLLYRAWDRVPWRRSIVLLLMVCGVYRMAEAERIAPFYAQRTQWLHDRIEEARAQGSSKAIVDPGTIAFGTMDDRVMLYWSAGVESLLLSAKEGHVHTVSIITTDDLACAGVPENLDKLVLRCWDVLETDYLDEQYFTLATASYAMLPGRATK